MGVFFLPQQLLFLCIAAVRCPAGLCLYANAMAGQAFAASEESEVIQLSQEHHDAVNRRRRIVVQYDAHGELGVDFKQWLAYRFSYIDEPGSQIDSVWWDSPAIGRPTQASCWNVPSILDCRTGGFKGSIGFRNL